MNKYIFQIICLASITLLSCSTTPVFHESIIIGNDNMFNKGLKVNKNINLTHEYDQNIRSSLDLSFAYKREKYARKLIEEGAVVKKQYLMMAVKNNWQEICDLLISKGIQPEQPHLSEAIRARNYEISKLLISKNLYPDISDIEYTLENYNYTDKDSSDYKLVKLLKTTGVGASKFEEQLDNAYLEGYDDKYKSLLNLGVKGPSIKAKKEKSYKEYTEVFWSPLRIVDYDSSYRSGELERYGQYVIYLTLSMPKSIKKTVRYKGFQHTYNLEKCDFDMTVPMSGTWGLYRGKNVLGKFRISNGEIDFDNYIRW